MAIGDIRLYDENCYSEWTFRLSTVREESIPDFSAQVPFVPVRNVVPISKAIVPGNGNSPSIQYLIVPFWLHRSLLPALTYV